MHMKPIVYIASAYSIGNQADNVRDSMILWNRLFEDGFVIPIAPLWSHFQHILTPKTHDQWLDFDLALLKSIPAILRVRQRASTGANKEEFTHRKEGKHVTVISHYASSLHELYEWVFNEYLPTLKAQGHPLDQQEYFDLLYRYQSYLKAQ